MADVKKKGVYDWTSLDHAPECPRHPDYDRKKYEAIQRQMLGIDPSAPLPDIRPIPDCSQVEGKCCPGDIVINASSRTVMVAAEGVPAVKVDNPRIDVGDRRQGPYYVHQIHQPINLGLARVVDLPVARLLELDKVRQVRTGDRAPDWVLQARKKAAEGRVPPALNDKTTAMSELERAAKGLD